MIEETKEIIKDTLKDAQETIKQRFLSPMYSYFILSWIITNWKFVFALFFISSDDVYGEKLDYLIKFYPLNDLNWIWSISKLVIIPALSSAVFVWWFSQLSEKFYERNETFKMNKKTIKRKLDYKDKVGIAEEQRKIREEESDKNEIRYIDQKDFNTSMDEGQENVSVNGLDFLPSEVLFNTDPESYKDQLNEYLAENNLEKK